MIILLMLFQKFDQELYDELMKKNEEEFFDYLANVEKKLIKQKSKTIYKALKAKKWSIHYLKDCAINRSIMGTLSPEQIIEPTPALVQPIHTSSNHRSNVSSAFNDDVLCIVDLEQIAFNQKSQKEKHELHPSFGRITDKSLKEKINHRITLETQKKQK